MLLQQLFEYFDPSTMTKDVWDKIPKVIEGFAKEKLPQLLKELIPYENNNVEAITKARKIAYDNDDWKEADKLGDKLSNVSSDARDRFEEVLGPLQDELVNEMRQRIEVSLQDIARDAIETKLGKIEPYDNKSLKSFDDQGNLYWLEHILVHINTTTKYKDGPRTSGGYFQNYPSQDEFSNHQYSKDLNWKEILSQGIVIYSSEEQLWNVAKSAILDQLEIEWYGETYGERHQVSPKFVTHITSTFVHEVNHLYQQSTRMKKGPGRGEWSLGLIPNPDKPRSKASEMRKKKRGSDRLNKDNPNGYRKFKPGKRGRPRLPGDVHTSNQWTEYFGTIDEIDSHAMGTAADAISEYYEELKSKGYRGEFNQSNLNYHIDQLIEGLRLGFMYAGSFQSYVNYVKEKIKDFDNQLPASALPKVDILHRKVWRLYMSRLIRYILAYKKDVAKSEWDDEEKQRPKLP